MTLEDFEKACYRGLVFWASDDGIGARKFIKIVVTSHAVDVTNVNCEEKTHNFDLLLHLRRRWTSLSNFSQVCLIQLHKSQPLLPKNFMTEFLTQFAQICDQYARICD